MRKLYVWLVVVLAILSLVVAVIYFTQSAGSLPHFFPGYLAGSTHIHTKHGLAFAVLAVVLGLCAWMLSGPRPAETPRPSSTDTTPSQ